MISSIFIFCCNIRYQILCNCDQLAPICNVSTLLTTLGTTFGTKLQKFISFLRRICYQKHLWVNWNIFWNLKNIFTSLYLSLSLSRSIALLTFGQISEIKFEVYFHSEDKHRQRAWEYLPIRRLSGSTQFAKQYWRQICKFIAAVSSLVLAYNEARV